MLDELRLDRDGRWYTAEYKTRAAGRHRRLHNHHTKEIQQRRRDLIALLQPGAKADSLPKEVWNGARPEKWRRLDPDRPAYTILAQMHRDLSEWVHPYYQRWITVREAARLQSFHDGFVFQTSEWQMLKQVGNACSFCLKVVWAPRGSTSRSTPSTGPEPMQSTPTRQHLFSA